MDFKKRLKELQKKREEVMGQLQTMEQARLDLIKQYGDTDAQIKLLEEIIGEEKNN